MALKKDVTCRYVRRKVGKMTAMDAVGNLNHHSYSMENFEVSFYWEEFAQQQQEVLHLLRRTVEQARENPTAFSWDAAEVEETFSKMDLSIFGLAELFNEDKKLVQYLWSMEEALEQLFEMLSNLRGLSFEGAPLMWEFLDAVYLRLDQSMNLFDENFVMTRTPRAFVDVEGMLQALKSSSTPSALEDSNLLARELLAMGSLKSDDGQQGEPAPGPIPHIPRGREIDKHDLLLLLELRETGQVGFWDKKLFKCCLKKAVGKAGFKADVFLSTLEWFVNAGKLSRERSAAFRLCFFLLMRFQDGCPSNKYTKSGRYRLLQELCRLGAEERAELQSAIPGLREGLRWVAEAWGEAAEGSHFDSEAFLHFLKSAGPQPVAFSNPARVVMFYMTNLVHLPSFENLKLKLCRLAALQVFTGTSFKRINTTLSEIEGMSHWPHEEEVRQFLEGLKIGVVKEGSAER